MGPAKARCSINSVLPVPVSAASCGTGGIFAPSPFPGEPWNPTREMRLLCLLRMCALTAHSMLCIQKLVPVTVFWGLGDCTQNVWSADVLANNVATSASVVRMASSGDEWRPDDESARSGWNRARVILMPDAEAGGAEQKCVTAACEADITIQCCGLQCIQSGPFQS